MSQSNIHELLPQDVDVARKSYEVRTFSTFPLKIETSKKYPKSKK